MQNRLTVLAAGAAALIISAGTTWAQLMFDPAVHKLEDMEPLVLGSKDNNFHMAPKEYRLKVGQGYRWEIKAETDFEYAVVAPEFFRNIFIRSIEAEEIEISTPTLEKIAFEDVGEVELTFVAIRPGTYEFGVEKMKERGMIGRIVVEAGGNR